MISNFDTFVHAVHQQTHNLVPNVYSQMSWLKGLEIFPAAFAMAIPDLQPGLNPGTLLELPGTPEYFIFWICLCHGTFQIPTFQDTDRTQDHLGHK